MAPRTKYARNGDLSIAFQVDGDGPVDLVQAPGFISHVEYNWEDPGFAHYLRRFAAFSRHITFDKRGTGLSDRAAGIATMEERMDDVRAVMDAAGSERAIIFGVSESAPLACLFAATYPERTSALILYAAYASEVRQPDYPWPPTAAEYAAVIDVRAATIHQSWGTGEAIKWLAPSMARDPDYVAWFGTHERLGASPGAVIALDRMNGLIDVRQILPAVHVPTLLLHRLHTGVYRVEEGRYVAAHIPGAQLVELPGVDYLPFAGDTDALVDEIETFVTGKRPITALDRILATVMVIEVTGSAARAVALGDRRWSASLDRLKDLALAETEQFRGRLWELTDGRIVASFDGPARAIRCAEMITNATLSLGLGTRTGLHTGECEVQPERLAGVAVSLAAWVAAQALPGELLVSSTVKDLVAGAGLRFVDRGRRRLGPGSDAWRLYAIVPDHIGAAGTAGRPGPTTSMALHTSLTRRERDVLCLLERGLSNKEIATSLSVGERTAESHVASILAKLGVASRSRLAAGLYTDGLTVR